jgi:hypothetical protein
MSAMKVWVLIVVVLSKQNRPTQRRFASFSMSALAKHIVGGEPSGDFAIAVS